MYNPYQDILKLKKQIKWLKEKFECQLTNKCCDDNNDTPPADVIERTSQLINDGENGLQPFIVDAELSDKIINGNVFWLQSGLTFQSTNPITYRLAGTVFQAPEKTFVLDSADPVLSRIDVFAVNLQSEVVVVKGEPSLDPQEPAIEFGSQLRINSVLISAAATEPSNPNGEPITSTLVYNENLEEPNEWDNDVFNPLTNNVPSGQVIFNSTQSPSNGAVSIETTNLERLTTIRFKNDTKIDFATLSSIFFDFKSKVDSIYNCTIKLYDDTTLVKSTTFSNGENGLNTDISLSYQPVNVPASSFQSFTRPNTVLFNTITFNFNIPNGTKSNVLPSFYLDKINLLFNSENPDIGTTFLNLPDVLESTYTGKGDTYISPNAQGTGVVFKPIDDIKNDIDYNNLNNAPTKTSDFQNDGNGGDPFITINEVPPVVTNTYIKGGALSVTTKEELGALFVNVDDFEQNIYPWSAEEIEKHITSFKIIGNDIECVVSKRYALKPNVGSLDEPLYECTEYIDYEGWLTEFVGTAFRYNPNIQKFIANGYDTKYANTTSFINATSLKHFEALNYRGNLDLRGCTALEKQITPNISGWGTIANPPEILSSYQFPHLTHLFGDLTERGIKKVDLWSVVRITTTSKIFQSDVPDNTLEEIRLINAIDLGEINFKNINKVKVLDFPNAEKWEHQNNANSVGRFQMESLELLNIPKLKTFGSTHTVINNMFGNIDFAANGTVFILNEHLKTSNNGGINANVQDAIDRGVTVVWVDDFGKEIVENQLRTVINDVTTDKNRNDQSSMVRLSNGDLAIAYSNFGANTTDISASEIAYQISQDNGDTWSDPKILIPKIENGSYIPSLYVKPDGNVLCIFFVRHSIALPYSSSIRKMVFSNDLSAVIEGQSVILDDTSTSYKPIAPDRIFYDEANDKLLFPYPILQSGTGNSTISVYKSYLLYSDDNGDNWNNSSLEIEGFLNFEGFGGAVEPGLFDNTSNITYYSRNMVGQIGACNIEWNGTDYTKDGSEYKLKIQAANAQSSIKYIKDLRGWIAVYTRLNNDPTGFRGQIDMAYSTDLRNWSVINTIDDATQIGTGIVNEPNIHISDKTVFVTYSGSDVLGEYALKLYKKSIRDIQLGSYSNSSYSFNSLSDDAVLISENHHNFKDGYNSSTFSAITRSNTTINDDVSTPSSKTFYANISYQTLKNAASSLKSYAIKSFSNFSPQNIFDGVWLKGVFSKIDLTSMGGNALLNGAKIDKYVGLRIQRLFNEGFDPGSDIADSYAILQEGEDDKSAFLGKLIVGDTDSIYNQALVGEGNVVYQIKSKNSGNTSIFFGTTGSEASGRLEYNNASEYIRLIAGNSEALKATSSEVSSSKKLSISNEVKCNTLNIANIPTSSNGLSAGDVWNDNGVLKIV